MIMRAINILGVFCIIVVMIAGVIVGNAYYDNINDYNNLLTKFNGLEDNYKILIGNNNKLIDERDNLVDEQNELINKWNNLSGENSELKEDIEKLEIINAQHDFLLNRYKERGMILENPSLKEIKAFLRDDKTKYNDWTNEYSCIEFSYEMITNAKAEGIYACSVIITYANTAHMIVAFNTTDNGIVYVEPQYGTIVELGNEYWGNKIAKISSCYELIIR